MRADDSLSTTGVYNSSYKITNIVLDLASIPFTARSFDPWAVWVYNMNGNGQTDALIANLSLTMSQVRVDLEFSMDDDVRFVVKCSNTSAGVVYVNGYFIDK